MPDHVRSKPSWVLVLLIERDTSTGFESSHTAWLEGRLYGLMQTAENAVLSNGLRPGDNTVPLYAQRMLAALIGPISRVLRLIGYDPAPAYDNPPVVPVGRSEHSTGHPHRPARCWGAHPRPAGVHDGHVPADALLNGDATILWAGQTSTSLSAAGAAAAGRTAINGWAFWAVDTHEGRIPLATVRERHSTAQER